MPMVDTANTITGTGLSRPLPMTANPTPDDAIRYGVLAAHDLLANRQESPSTRRGGRCHPPGGRVLNGVSMIGHHDPLEG
jgi:hypothetical protein